MRDESCFGHVIFEVYMKSPKDELLLQVGNPEKRLRRDLIWLILLNFLREKKAPS